MVDIVDKLIGITKDMHDELEASKEQMLQLEKKRVLYQAELVHLKHKVARRDQAIVDLKDRVHVETSGHARYVALTKELKGVMSETDRAALKAPCEKRAASIVDRFQGRFDELYASHTEADEDAEKAYKEKARKVADQFKAKASSAASESLKSPIGKKAGKGKKPENGEPKQKRQGLRSAQNRHMSAVTPEWNEIKKAAQAKKQTWPQLFNYAKTRWDALPEAEKKVYQDAFEAEKAARDAAKIANGEKVPKKSAASKSNGQKSAASNSADEDEENGAAAAAAAEEAEEDAAEEGEEDAAEEDAGQGDTEAGESDDDDDDDDDAKPAQSTQGNHDEEDGNSSASDPDA